MNRKWSGPVAGSPIGLGVGLLGTFFLYSVYALGLFGVPFLIVGIKLYAPLDLIAGFFGKQAFFQNVGFFGSIPTLAGTFLNMIAWVILGFIGGSLWNSERRTPFNIFVVLIILALIFA